MMTACQTFKPDWELDVAGADNVLDLEVCEFCVKAKLLDDTSVYAEVSDLESHHRGTFAVAYICGRPDASRPLTLRQ